MMIGPRFAQDLRAAGLAGVAISWSTDGTVTGVEDLPAGQRAAVEAVLAAHDPRTAADPTPAEQARAQRRADLDRAVAEPGVSPRLRAALLALWEEGTTRG